MCSALTEIKTLSAKEERFLIFAGSEPSVAVIDTKFSMESDSSHGGCHNMLCRKERQRLGDEIESLKKEKISRICWLVEQTDIYIYIYIYIYIHDIYNIPQNLAYRAFMYTSPWQVLSSLNNRRTYIQGLQALKKECSERAVVKTCISTIQVHLYLLKFLDIDASK